MCSIIPALLHLFIDLHESVVGPVNENIFFSILTNLLGWLSIFTWLLCMTKGVFRKNNESPEEKNTSLHAEHRQSLIFKVKIISGI